MTDHGILFKGKMVQAWLAGRKTQTRRIVSEHNSECPSERWENLDWSKPAWVDGVGSGSEYLKVHGPDGTIHRVHSRIQPGDQIYVKETWAQVAPCVGNETDACTVYRSDGVLLPDGYKWRSSMLMPRCESRILLEVVSVRAQRLQEISEDDAWAEGVVGYGTTRSTHEGRELYRDLWDSINGDKPGCSFADNPFVWAITFKRAE